MKDVITCKKCKKLWAVERGKEFCTKLCEAVFNNLSP